MNPESLAYLAGSALLTLGMWWLRRQDRRRNPGPPDPEGFEVYRGTQREADSKLAVLADAGVMAWIETDQLEAVVLIDQAQAPAVGELLAAHRDGIKPEPDPERPVSIGEQNTGGPMHPSQP